MRRINSPELCSGKSSILNALSNAVCLMRKHVKSFEKNRQKVENVVPHLHIFIHYANFGRCHGYMN